MAKLEKEIECKTDQCSSDQLCLHESIIYNMHDLNVFEIQSSLVLHYENKACSFFSSRMYTVLRSQILQYLFNYPRKFKDTITIFPLSDLKITTTFLGDCIRISLAKLFPNIINSVAKREYQNPNTGDSRLSTLKKHKQS